MKPQIKTDKCRACPETIFWAKQNPTASNPEPKNNPINFSPSANGNLRLNLETLRYDVLTGESLKAARAANEPLYLSHFVTCLNRGRFRKQ